MHKYEEKIQILLQENQNVNDALNQRFAEDEDTFGHLNRVIEEKDQKISHLETLLD